MRSGRSRWVSGIGAVLVIGGCSTSHNHTLRWDQALPAAQRFLVLAAFNNAAVLDRNTGLVWEKSPATPAGEGTWGGGTRTCLRKTTGGQQGWRLPAIPELASLLDPTVSPSPTLPAGHPFTNVQSGHYWSATMLAGSPSFAWVVSFNIGEVVVENLANTHHAWCVRGPMSESVY